MHPGHQPGSQPLRPPRTTGSCAAASRRSHARRCTLRRRAARSCRLHLGSVRAATAVQGVAVDEVDAGAEDGPDVRRVAAVVKVGEVAQGAVEDGRFVLAQFSAPHERVALAVHAALVCGFVDGGEDGDVGRLRGVAVEVEELVVVVELIRQLAELGAHPEGRLLMDGDAPRLGHGVVVEVRAKGVLDHRAGRAHGRATDGVLAVEEAGEGGVDAQHALTLAHVLLKDLRLRVEDLSGVLHKADDVKRLGRARFHERALVRHDGVVAAGGEEVAHVGGRRPEGIVKEGRGLGEDEGCLRGRGGAQAAWHGDWPLCERICALVDGHGFADGVHLRHELCEVRRGKVRLEVRLRRPLFHDDEARLRVRALHKVVLEAARLLPRVEGELLRHLEPARLLRLRHLLGHRHVHSVGRRGLLLLAGALRRALLRLGGELRVERLAAVHVDRSPLGHTEAEALAAEAVHLVAGLLRHDRAVVARVDLANVVRHAEEEEAKVEEHIGHCLAGHLRATAVAALGGEGRAELAVARAPIVSSELVPPLLHAPRHAAQVGRGAARDGVAPEHVCVLSLIAALEAHLVSGDLAGAFGDVLGHLGRAVRVAVVHDEDAAHGARGLDAAVRARAVRLVVRG
mmetsp:Transcript_18845/g.55245  ORF Transcript_18845/g.55245 Transcript_18845/m.55245 type:complete len:627 (-) Transcript_18845:19-1899(-)